MLLHQLRGFRVDAAECFKAHDRIFVEGKIKHWFGSLENFEERVRTDLTKLVSAKLEESGPVPWRAVFIASLPHLFIGVDVVVALGIRKEWDKMVRFLMLTVSISCFTDAIAIGVALRLADRMYFRSLWRGTVATALLFSVCIGQCMATMSTSLPLWIAALIHAVLGCITVWLYGGFRWFRFRGRTGILSTDAGSAATVGPPGAAAVLAKTSEEECDGIASATVQQPAGCEGGALQNEDEDATFNFSFEEEFN